MAKGAMEVALLLVLLELHAITEELFSLADDYHAGLHPHCADTHGAVSAAERRG